MKHTRAEATGVGETAARVDVTALLARVEAQEGRLDAQERELATLRAPLDHRPAERSTCPRRARGGIDRRSVHRASSP